MAGNDSPFQYLVCCTCAAESHPLPLGCPVRGSSWEEGDDTRNSIHPIPRHVVSHPVPSQLCKGSAAVDSVTGEWAGTGASPVICASDLLCPGGKLPK